MNTVRPCMLIILLLAIFSATYAQKYQLKESKTTFFSTTPIEDIDAVTKETKGILDAGAKTFFFKIPIASFVFKSDLMRDHFNENYMESEKFPNATFKGTIEGNFDLTKDGSYLVSAIGDMTIHGVVKKVSIPSTISVKEGVASIDSKFKVALKDYSIDIPTVVFNKIAEVLEVKITAQLEPMK